MVVESSRTVKLRSALLVVLAALYVAWAAFFIARSSVETSSGRYFCLFDDAMVSLHYAWNLAHGNGLVWNPGERVEGNPSFLLTLSMAAGALLLGKSAAALFVQITAIPLVLGVALLAHRLGRLLDPSPYLGPLTMAAVLAYYPLSYWSLMGMETGLLTALAMAALLLAMRLGSDPQGSKLLGLLLGLMFATRPDAAVPAAMILAFRAAWILRGPRVDKAGLGPAKSFAGGFGNPPRVPMSNRGLGALRPWLVEVAVFAGIIGGLTLFRWVYYGSPVPNTYPLKMANWPLRWRLLNGWKFIVPFLDTTRYLFLPALGSLVFHPDGRRLLLLCFAVCVVACQIWVGGDAWPYWRMLVPAVVVLIVAAVDGASSLVRWVVRHDWRFLVAGFSAACLAWALWLADQPFMNELRMNIPAYTVAMNQSRVQDGLALAHYADPQASVAVFAAGVVPYYSGLRGVDAFGKSDRPIAQLPGPGFADGRTVSPGHNKLDLHHSIETLLPDVICDAPAWARYGGPEMFEFVRRNYVQKGPFWLRRDSPHVHWDRLPKD
jgi:arabinofuranosyltransferase